MFSSFDKIYIMKLMDNAAGCGFCINARYGTP
jgi:hypothetical protein